MRSHGQLSGFQCRIFHRYQMGDDGGLGMPAGLDEVNRIG